MRILIGSCMQSLLHCSSWLPTMIEKILSLRAKKRATSSLDLRKHGIRSNVIPAIPAA